MSRENSLTFVSCDYGFSIDDPNDSGQQRFHRQHPEWRAIGQFMETARPWIEQFMLLARRGASERRSKNPGSKLIHEAYSDLLEGVAVLDEQLSSSRNREKDFHDEHFGGVHSSLTPLSAILSRPLTDIRPEEVDILSGRWSAFENSVMSAYAKVRSLIEPGGNDSKSSSEVSGLWKDASDGGAPSVPATRGSGSPSRQQGSESSSKSGVYIDAMSMVPDEAINRPNIESMTSESSERAPKEEIARKEDSDQSQAVSNPKLAPHEGESATVASNTLSPEEKERQAIIQRRLRPRGFFRINWGGVDRGPLSKPCKPPFYFNAKGQIVNNLRYCGP